MDTLFLFWALVIFAIFIGKALSSLFKSTKKTLGSYKADDIEGATSLIRLYQFDKTYDPQSFFYRKEREIRISSLPDELIMSELANLREQYKAYLESTNK